MSAVYSELIRSGRTRARRFALASVALVASSFLLLAFALSSRHVSSLAGLAGVALALYAGGLTVTRSFYVLSRVIVMRAAGAEPVSRSQRPDLHRLLDEVCVSAGLATPPRLYLLEDSAPNSFASGSSPESSVIVLTTGLVESLPRYELRAVIAHEVTHIIADDMRIPALSYLMVLVASVFDVIAWGVFHHEGRSRDRIISAARWLRFLFLFYVVTDLYFFRPAFLLALPFMVLVLPLAARLLHFAVLRERKQLADVLAAKIIRDPQSMVDAMRRIEMSEGRVAHLLSSTSYLWFHEPYTEIEEGILSRALGGLAAHPTLPRRVAHLASLNGGAVDVERPLRPARGAG